MPELYRTGGKGGVKSRVGCIAVDFIEEFSTYLSVPLPTEKLSFKDMYEEE